MSDGGSGAEAGGWMRWLMGYHSPTRQIFHGCQYVPVSVLLRIDRCELNPLGPREQDGL